ncbi:MAG: HAD domain-containing protein [Sandaracinus sp.]
MRVVFLDFDGVLNAVSDDSSPALGELWSAAWLDRGLVERLATIVDRSSAVVVISSSWRQRRTREELAEMLASHGLRGEVLDVTPRLPKPPEGERRVRAAEIEAWLDAHDPVEGFVVLDDEPDMGRLTRQHVRTDPTTGISDDDVARALEILCAGCAAPDGRARSSSEDE